MAEFLCIQPGSRAVRQFCEAVLVDNEHPSLDTFVADDLCGVTYRVTQDIDNPQKFRMEVMFANLAEVRAAGGDEILTKLYAGLVGSSPDDHTVVLEVDGDGTLPCSKEELVDRLACFGRNMVGAPIMLALEALQASNLAETPSKKVTIASNGQCMFVSTAADRVRVEYCLNFRDPADVAVARVIMQELSETSNLGAGWRDTTDIPGAPASNVGYLVLNMLKSNKNIEKSTTQAVYFPHYLDYHVKATKAFVHSRMRRRVDELVKVLNRARPEVVGAAKRKKKSSRHGAGAGAGAGAGSR